MYRTSTQDMSIKSPAHLHREHISGHSGYISGKTVNADPGKTFTQLTVGVLNRDKFMPMRPFTSIHGKQTLYGRFGGGMKDEYHALSGK